uniref:UDP-glycosyltransferases domain-containing protein n=1 Tax=Electrophorus electricus TaxID=8005 RepID=A0A4W4ENZ8_ELEEL
MQLFFFFFFFFDKFEWNRKCGTAVLRVLFLLTPGEFSHWLNIKVIIDELIVRGHSVTVVTHSATPSVKTTEPVGYNVEVIQVPYTKQDIIDIMYRFRRYWTYDLPNNNILQASIKLKELTDVTMEHKRILCRKLFACGDLLEKWSKEQFDVLLTDPMTMCGELLAQKLNLPFIISLRFLFGSAVERLCGQLPAPPSYVPGFGLGYTNHMGFLQRVKNILYIFSQDLLFSFLAKTKWDSIYTEIMGEFSHWLNIKVIIDELISRGHSVTVVTHSATPSVKTTEHPGYNVEVIQVPYTKQHIIDIMYRFRRYWTYDLPKDNILQASLKLKELTDVTMEHKTILCRKLFAHGDLLEKWSKEKIDVLLTDPMTMCGELLAQKLNLPFIISLRFSFGSAAERLCGQLPAPPSYVPGVGIKYTDHMGFLQRVKNFLYIFSQDLLFSFVAKIKWDSIYTEIMGKPTTLCERIGKADIWLIRTYWDFDYPRPSLPNFKFVGGLHCKPAKPLPKVLWRYTGDKPDTLTPNTRLYDWIPQNDLLGHPKTKAFITHGGTNGLYEAIYHGVPMVGLPLFVDQPDNMNHMRTKGAAVMLDFNKMESKDLKEALTDVIHNPSYKKNIMRLSRIHHDQPMKPLDQAVFWIEYVMRNKGYYCLDVAAFLLSITALVIFIFVKTCSGLFRKCLRKTTTRKGKKE